MSETLKSASHDIAADISALRKDISNLSDTVARLVTAQADTAREQVKSTANAYLKMGTDQFNDAKHQIEVTAADVEKRIEHHPYAAMAIAAGLGLVIDANIMGTR